LCNGVSLTVFHTVFVSSELRSAPVARRPHVGSGAEAYGNHFAFSASLSREDDSEHPSAMARIKNDRRSSLSGRPVRMLFR